ncbi:MAG: hypothetical protein GY715_07820, partial [Planctomycetes bacterium]|nr:hypothetical protein [Planctomycetota bacterium]
DPFPQRRVLIFQLLESNILVHGPRCNALQAKAQTTTSCGLLTRERLPSAKGVREEQDLGRVLHCPRCEADELTPVRWTGSSRAEGAIVDVCRKCRGVWLDQGELAKVRGGLHRSDGPDPDDGWFRGLLQEIFLFFLP